ncbi:MAG: Mur ligase family protein [Ruminococcus callidus]
MEVFFSLCPCKIYAVTGSDGKTTTTTLISEFLSRAGCVHKAAILVALCCRLLKKSRR